MAMIVVDPGTPPVGPGGQPQPVARIQLQYFLTPPGICKLVEFLAGIILLFLSKHIFLAIVNYLLFVLTTLWMSIYLFGLKQRYAIHPPWVVVEFYYTGGAFLLYALATVIGFFIFNWAASAFALIITLAYGAGAFLLFKEWREWKDNPDIPK